MAYETLNETILKSTVKKPNYTPANSIKKAYKVLRKFFKSSNKQSKHKKFLNETIQDDDDEYISDEESENFENERLEASSAAAGLH